MEYALYLALLVIPLILMLGGNIWLYARIWRVSGGGWFLLCLFIPIVTLYWLVKNWNEGRKPFVVGLVGSVLSIGAAELVISRMQGEKEVLSQPLRARERRPRVRVAAAASTATVTATSATAAVATRTTEIVRTTPATSITLPLSNPLKSLFKRPTPQPTKARSGPDMTVNQLVEQVRINKEQSRPKATAPPVATQVRARVSKSDLIDISFNSNETTPAVQATPAP